MPLVFPHLFLGRSLSSVRLLSLLYLSSCSWSSLTSSLVGRCRRSGHCRHYYICRHALCVFASLSRLVVIVDRVIVIVMTIAHLFLGRSLSSVRLLSSLLYLSSCPWSSLTSFLVGRYRRSGYYRQYHRCRHALRLPSPLPR